jgi:hypothetical protein
LAVRDDKGVAEDEKIDRVGDFRRGRLQQLARAGVPDERHRLVLPLQDADNGIDVVVKPDAGAIVLRVRSGQSGRLDFVTGLPQPGSNAVPSEPAMPGAVNQDEPSARTDLIVGCGNRCHVDHSCGGTGAKQFQRAPPIKSNHCQVSFLGRQSSAARCQHNGTAQTSVPPQSLENTPRLLGRS